MIEEYDCDLDEIIALETETYMVEMVSCPSCYEEHRVEDFDDWFDLEGAECELCGQLVFAKKKEKEEEL